MDDQLSYNERRTAILYPACASSTLKTTGSILLFIKGMELTNEWDCMSGASGGQRTARLRISRRRRRDGFVYLRDNRQIKDQRTLKRISSLAIPPAWHEVEISASASGRVQARGVDDAGRTQRIYHPSFRRRREEEKFSRLSAFGRALPGLREQVERDLRRHHLPAPKVIAAIVRLLDLHLLRIGSPRYARHYGSFGAVTLRRRHTRVFASRVEVNFTGKSGQRQRLTVTDPILVRVLARLYEQPGYELFRIRQDSGSYRAVAPQDVNAYLHEHAGAQFSAKDFRTWGGTLAAMASLLDGPLNTGSTPHECARAEREAVKEVAGLLGNTPATARAAYIDPRILALAREPAQLESLRTSRRHKRERARQSIDEQCLLQLLDESAGR